MKALFRYPRHFEHESVGPHIRLDVVFQNNQMDTEIKPAQSLVSSICDLGPDAEMECISPLETSADKFCSLTWRTFEWERGDKGYNPTDMRHVHDLSALKDTIVDERNLPLFIQAVRQKLLQDLDNRSSKAVDAMTLGEVMGIASDRLQSGLGYRQDYEKYVDEMSYLPPQERTSFDEAVAGYLNIWERVKPEVQDSRLSIGNTQSGPL